MTTYQLPPKSIVELLDTPPDPVVIWSYDARYAILASRFAMPDLSALARRYLPLAGLRIDPLANSLFQTEFYSTLVLLDRQTNQRIPLGFPESRDGPLDSIDGPASVSRIGFVSWSHRGNGFVFSRVTDSGTQLWYVCVQSPSSPVLLTDRLHTVLQGIDWMPDGVRVLCALVPQGHGCEPQKESVPDGPSVQEADGRKAPARTYQDLLNNADDEALFEHYTHSQLAILSPHAEPQIIGEPCMNWFVSSSPDGEHLLSVRLKKPFSYSLPVDFFPRSIEVLDLDGQQLVSLADIPLSDALPIEGVRLGPRGVQWWPGKAATLAWVEALDGGDPSRVAEYREDFKVWDSPFEKPPVSKLRLKGRYTGLTFFSDPAQWMTSEYDRDRRWTTSLLHREIQSRDWIASKVNPIVAPVATGNDGGDAESRVTSQVFFDRSVRDRYGDPGRILLEANQAGFSIAKQLGRSVLLAGVGAGPEGNRPFLDERNLDTLETIRRWRCPADCSENVVSVLAWEEDSLKVLTRRESPSDPPNYYLHELRTESSNTVLQRPNPRQLTHYIDSTPQLRRYSKRIVRYERADGVPLSGTLYLPDETLHAGPYPLLLWSYPLEFNDASTAGQVAINPNAFLRVTGSNHLALLTQGYAILDDATMPVIGDPETMNDTFIEQIVGAAHAAIDHLAVQKVIDPQRVAIGGHSYGAFMTANVLAHSDRFRAGIARSGAYNRTLTPFGFQSERRPLWQAKEIYSKLSPLMQADRIKTPLLLIHGELDSNPGTFSMQSQRMFQAIRGNGGIAKLVMLPLEGHSYRARQSVMHVQYETAEWLKRYM